MIKVNALFTNAADTILATILAGALAARAMVQAPERRSGHE